MTKPFREGQGWAIRLREKDQDIYQSGFATQAQAKKKLTELQAEIRAADDAYGKGPFQTTVAQAFLMYARERLPYLKGARSDVLIINRYLRAQNLPTVKLEPIDDITHKGPQLRASAPQKIYWKVTLVREEQRAIPKTPHRRAQQERDREGERARCRLANMRMADVTPRAVQAVLDARINAGYRSATILNERSELRRLFSHASRQWNWSRPGRNPASNVIVPRADPARDVVLTNAQWESLSYALCQAGNAYALALFCLLLETAMRSGEALTTARWCHVSWTKRVLNLPDAKAGAREVPLGPGAIKILKQLLTRAQAKHDKTWSDDDQIFPTTYEAIKKAWAVARKICNEGENPIGDLRIHDLRHTSATRYSLEFKGDLPMIKSVTGHKTDAMATRYIHLKAETVADIMHGEEPPVEHSPAGYQASTVDVLERAQQAAENGTADLDRIHVANEKSLTSNVVPIGTRQSAA